MAPAAMGANSTSEYAPTGGKGGALSNYTGSTDPSSQTTTATPAFPQYSQSAGGQTSGGQPAGPQQPNMFQQASNAINAGMAGAYGEMGYNPMMINPTAFSTGYQTIDPNAANWEAAQTTQADMDRFYNPYVNQVVDTSLSDIDRARQMQQNQAAAKAQAAGAFGGSRGALMETEIGRNALDQAARTGSQLRSAGFTQAANLAQQDVARRQQASQMNAAQQMQALLANQSAGLTSSQASAQNALQAMLANQGMQLAGSDQRLAAGQQLANIGNLGFGQAQDVQANFQQQGAMQQALQQQLLDAARMQYQGYTGAGDQSLQNLIAAISGAPIPSATSQSSTPGLLDMATSGAMIYALMGMPPIPSDRRLKTDIKKVGKLGNGLNVYTWKWNDEGKKLAPKNQPEIGVIAQEVQEVIPEAVVRGDHGYLTVNYGALI